MPASDQYIGEIMLVPYNFAPLGWAECNGQILSIAQNTALFSLLGTTYGGNGQTTFALPDLRGRHAIHRGQGPGLSLYDLGQVGGVETVTLLSSQMPQHNHNLILNNDTVNIAATGSNSYLTSKTESGESISSSAASSSVPANPGSIGVAGGSQPHENMSPYLTLTYCIALQGIFPSRN